MSFLNWFKSGKNKNDQVEVVKLKEKAAGQDAMASGNLSAAAQTMAKIVEQKKAPTKVLMVQDGDYMQQVTDYALKMAQRLDCEIIALDVSEAPLQFSGERKERESNRFFERAKKSAESFTLQAEAMGIVITHVMEIGDQEEVIARLSSQDAGIRYVLTKPEQDLLEVGQERAQVPVFDLNCSRLSPKI